MTNGLYKSICLMLAVALVLLPVVSIAGLSGTAVHQHQMVNKIHQHHQNHSHCQLHDVDQDQQSTDSQECTHFGCSDCITCLLALVVRIIDDRMSTPFIEEVPVPTLTSVDSFSTFKPPRIFLNV